ncbi:hypothetical protein niasHT_002986 [Heterodera trifolii]|uniref:Uncharacterized protein n=1 Tax=Heterodera trifolii TaxID=157864 RepID=A0ABD2LQ60_9BILA
MDLLRSTQTLKNREAENYLVQRGIEKGSTVMAAKKEPGKGKGSTVATTVTTNLFGIDMKKPVTVFRYEVKISGHIMLRSGEELNIDLTEQTKFDFLNVDRRYLCRDVFREFERRIETKGNMLYYDLSHTLFALKKLDINENGIIEQFTTDAIPDRDPLLKHFPLYSVTVTPVVSEGGQLTIGDFAFLTNDVAQMDQSLAQFLNIASSQSVFSDPNGHFMHYSASSIYLMRPEEHGFTAADSPQFRSNSSFLGIGMDKSVRIVENGLKQGDVAGAKAAMVVQVQKTPFHKVEPMLEKFKKVVPRWNGGLLENGELAHVSRMLRGLYVHTTYNQQAIQRFPIYAFSPTNAKTEIVMVEDGQITVEQYYAHRYDIKLSAPCAPLVIRRERGKSTHYPMELLMICDYQRVRSAQMTPETNQEMIKACAIPPFLLRKQTDQLTNVLALNQSDHLTKASIRFAERPMEVPARILNPMQLKYADDKLELPGGDCRWRAGRYLLPAQINSWCAIALVDNSRDNNISLAGWKDFVDRYKLMMRMKGMTFEEPSVTEVYNVGNFDLRDHFTRMQNSGVEFVLVGHPKGHSGDSVHHQMKYNELGTEVITQSVLIATVNRIKSRGGAAETLENIVNKTNMKMGGLNYALPCVSEGMLKKTLVIGFAVNHPAGGFGMDSEQKNGNGSNGTSDTGSDAASDNGNGANGHKPQKKPQVVEKRVPSVVGYSANIGENNNFEFVGDYKYQEARRDEKLQIIDHIVCHCLNMYKQRRNNKNPSSVIIYRNACGEGFYQHLLAYEVPLVKRLLAEHCNGKTKLTLIVVNKLQNIRFTPSNIRPNERATEQNVRPGTLIDKGVVSPQWTEFFLASQRALQGTARVPRYAILVDDNEYSMDKIQQFTFALCFGHQIVSSSISLPAPVYIALEYAKRGRNNFNTDQQSAEARAAAAEGWDNYDTLNNHLGFENKTYLSKWRVNA